MRVKYVKPIWEKHQKINLQAITDVCVKAALLEIHFEKRNNESVAGNF